MSGTTTHAFPIKRVVEFNESSRVIVDPSGDSYVIELGDTCKAWPKVGDDVRVTWRRVMEAGRYLKVEADELRVAESWGLLNFEPASIKLADAVLEKHWQAIIECLVGHHHLQQGQRQSDFDAVVDRVETLLLAAEFTARPLTTESAFWDCSRREVKRALKIVERIKSSNAIINAEGNV